MSYLRTTEAARLLNVSPNTLRSWERRFGYPRPARTEGGHRQFRRTDIAALRDALQEGLSITSAISRAREGVVAGSADALRMAMIGFDVDRCNRVMELSLAVRSIDRTIDEVLLAALDQMVASYGTESARWAFAAEWAMAWIRRAVALTSAEPNGGTVLIGYASRPETDICSIRTRLLELLCCRAGAAAISLPVGCTQELGELLDARQPDIVVIVDCDADADATSRWAYQIRQHSTEVPIVVYEPARTDGPPLTGSLKRMGGSPLLASATVLSRMVTSQA